MHYNINIAIADDHEIFLDGLLLMLSKQKGFNVCGRALNGEQLITVVNQEMPDIVLTDIRMPVMDGIQSTKQLLLKHPDLKVIALSMFDEENLIVEMLEAGAKGYLLKNAHKQEIIDAIFSVYHNKNYYCTHTTSRLASMIVRSKFTPYKSSPSIDLNDREKEIIQLICLQRTNQEIADQVYLSKRTVEGYRTKIMEKLNVKNIAGVVIFALKHNLLKEEDLV